MISANGGLPAHRYPPQVTQRWPRGSEPASLGLGFAVTPPIVAGALGGCAWVRVLVPPHHYWLGFVVCAVGLGFWLAPRHSWLGFWDVRGCVRALPVPRRSWLGCAVWVSVLGVGFQLHPATPGLGVGVCVCMCVCARSVCTPPLVAGVCGVGVCAWARVAAAPRHSWLGCWGVCVFVCALRLYPATSGWGVRCGCVCLGSGFSCAPHSWLGCWGVCVFVCMPCFHPATPGWGVRCVNVCLGSGCGCAPPLLAGALGCVCVFGCVLCFHPATPGLGVRCGCVCLGSGFSPATPG